MQIIEMDTPWFRITTKWEHIFHIFRIYIWTTRISINCSHCLAKYGSCSFATSPPDTKMQPAAVASAYRSESACILCCADQICGAADPSDDRLVEGLLSGHALIGRVAVDVRDVQVAPPIQYDSERAVWHIVDYRWSSRSCRLWSRLCGRCKHIVVGNTKKKVNHVSRNHAEVKGCRRCWCGKRYWIPTLSSSTTLKIRRP